MASDTEIEKYGLTVGEKGNSSDLDKALWKPVKIFQPFSDGRIDLLVPINRTVFITSFIDFEWNFKTIQQNIVGARLPIITLKCERVPLHWRAIFIRECDAKFRFRYPIHAVFCNICYNTYDDIKYIDITKRGCAGYGPPGSYSYYWYTITKLLCCPKGHIFESIY